MTREPPFSPPALTPREDLGLVVETRAYRLITPLYGGGVTPREADPVTVVRGTEVRGQLRFWWRAVRGGQFGGELAAMKAAEDALWGAASSADSARPSLVQVEVLPNPDIQPKPLRHDPNNRPLGQPGSTMSYVAFPLREHPQAAVLDDVAFTLRLEYPRAWTGTLAALFPVGASPEQELQAALWAWETFGGVGARTRRGFGALMRTDQQQSRRPVEARQHLAAIRKTLKAVATPGPWPPDVPHLTPTTRVAALSETHASGDEAWEDLFGRLRDFRQARPRPMARSTWPEPDAIRHLVLGRPRRVVKFPRASFGLPIVFQFKQPRDPHALPEPQGTIILRTSDYDRMASPLIIRPVPCDGNRFLGIAVVLEGPRLPPGQLELRHKGGSVNAPDDDLHATEAAAIRRGGHPVVRDAARPDGSVDVLAAFLNYLEEV